MSFQEEKSLDVQAEIYQQKEGETVEAVKTVQECLRKEFQEQVTRA